MESVRCASTACAEKMKCAIRIDTSVIPHEVCDNIAAATLDLIYGILQQPGGREALDARITARKATRG